LTTAPRPRRARIALVALALLAGCGGGKADRTTSTGEGNDAGQPARGGSVTYGLEAETGSGWCLPEAQLAISGIMVARAIYDPLLVPNAEGEYVPYLAESVEHDDDYTVWTITVREGITFHDGSPLTAEVVKNNLDANRGAPGDHARSTLLGIFIYDDIESVEVAGEREVVVTRPTPTTGASAGRSGTPCGRPPTRAPPCPSSRTWASGATARRSSPSRSPPRPRSDPDAPRNVRHPSRTTADTCRTVAVPGQVIESYGAQPQVLQWVP
jgi:hypothetical protein